jgi:hypothetical protein
MIMAKETFQEIVILSYMQSVIRPNMHTNMAEVFFSYIERCRVL